MGVLTVEGFDQGPIQAKEVKVDTSGFSKNLSDADTDVQHALETIDQMSGGGGPTNALLLDQTVEQHVINGSPHFDEGITVAKDKWVYLDG